MRLKTGDTAIVMAGKDKGKKGKVAAIFVKEERVVLEGVNLYTKHSRPKRQGEKGETVTVPRAIAEAKVMPFCSNCAKGVRIGSRNEGGKSLRFCRKCKVTI